MIFLIIESTFMKNVLEKNLIFKNDEIKIIATKGSFFSYFVSNGELEFELKEDKKEIKKFLESIDSEKNEIIIATDHDPAGELIAFEVSTFFSRANVYRFRKAVEELLIFRFIDKSFLKKYVTTKINILKAVRYLQERFFSDYQFEKLKVLKVFEEKGIVKIERNKFLKEK